MNHRCRYSATPHPDLELDHDFHCQITHPIALSFRAVLLLPSQINELLAVVDDSPYARSEIEIDQSPGYPIVRFAAERSRLWFVINGRGPAYDIKQCPGERVFEEQFPVAHWAELLKVFAKWLRNIKRELAAVDRMGDPSTTVPPWGTLLALTIRAPEYSL